MILGYRRPEPLHAEHDLAGFRSGVTALDDWLRRHARAASSSGSARVFVVTLDGVAVVAYYALAAAQVAPEQATERARRGEPARRPIPAILLARLAVAEPYQRQGVGRALLADAMRRTLAAAQTIGARVLVVHAKDEPARDWYTSLGFAPSPTDPLHLMVVLKDGRLLLDRESSE